VVNKEGGGEKGKVDKKRKGKEEKGVGMVLGNGHTVFPLILVHQGSGIAKKRRRKEKPWERKKGETTLPIPLPLWFLTLGMGLTGPGKEREKKLDRKMGGGDGGKTGFYLFPSTLLHKFLCNLFGLYREEEKRKGKTKKKKGGQNPEGHLCIIFIHDHTHETHNKKGGGGKERRGKDGRKRKRGGARTRHDTWYECHMESSFSIAYYNVRAKRGKKGGKMERGGPGRDTLIGLSPILSLFLPAVRLAPQEEGGGEERFQGRKKKKKKNHPPTAGTSPTSPQSYSSSSPYLPTGGGKKEKKTPKKKKGKGRDGRGGLATVLVFITSHMLCGMLCGEEGRRERTTSEKRRGNRVTALL